LSRHICKPIFVGIFPAEQGAAAGGWVQVIEPGGARRLRAPPCLREAWPHDDTSPAARRGPAGAVFYRDAAPPGPRTVGRSCASEAAWAAQLAELKKYKRTPGDCNVPVRWTGDLRLGRWAKEQRSLKKLDRGEPMGGRGRGDMTAERVAKLEALGFAWGTRESGPPSRVSTTDKRRRHAEEEEEEWEGGGGGGGAVAGAVEKPPPPGTGRGGMGLGD
jgi:hypothetical protein